VKEISVLPTLTASQELKNWYFTRKFLSQHHLYVNNTYTKFQGQKIHQKKDIQNLPRCVAVKKISLLPTLIASQGLKFLENQVLYVNNIFSKFQGQKINKKKRYSQSTNMCHCEKIFTIANFDTLPRAEKLFFFHEIFFDEIISMLKRCDPNFKAIRLIRKKIFEFNQHV